MGGERGQGSIQEPRKRYTKAECIGRGASKVVYKAFDEVEGIEVAWNEVLCSDACLGSGKERSRMLGEITMLVQLKHRNIMRLYDWWYDKQQQVLVFITELLTDGSLRRFIRRKHAAGITLSVLKRYAWQILQGLVYLHGHYPPIIHRDLKCDNIFVNGASGELKLGDLGFATLLRGISCPLSVIGTPEFMAPELYDEHYDEKVDIYSFGMCLLELATLEYPYSECTNPAQIYRKVSKGVPPAGLAKVVNPALRDFITLTIDPDPKRRPEARQLLVHPFFADVVAAIRAKGWAKGPGRTLGAAAAAAAAAGPQSAAAAVANGELVVGPAAFASSARVPMSAPDGLPGLTAAGEVGDIDAAKEQPAAAGMTWPAAVAGQQTPPAALVFEQLQLGCSSSPAAAAADASLPKSWPHAGSSCGPVLMQAALSCELEQQRDQQQGGVISSQQLSGPGAVVQQQQLLASCSAGSYPGVDTSSITWPALNIRTDAIAAPDAVAAAQSGSAVSLPLHSPFAAASHSFGSFASSAGSWGGRNGVAAAGAGNRPGSSREGAAPAAAYLRQRGRQPSLEEMSEEDVLFDADSQGTHTDEVDSEQDASVSSPGPGQTIPAVWNSIHQGQGQHALDPIREDGDDDDVDCVCRRIDQQQLSFNVGFFNTKGMRKRVGFQYNADEDTVDDIAVEMLENLSLMPQQASAIAEKIRAALEALGLPQNGTVTPAQAAAAGSSAGAAASPQLAGESVALAIVSTAAAAAAIESCGTPQPGSVDGDGAGCTASSAAGTPPVSWQLQAMPANGAAAAAEASAAADSSAGLALGSPYSHYGGLSPASANQLGLALAVAGSDVGAGRGIRQPQQQQLHQLAHAQQLVRELSMLHRDAGTALLHNLQEELLVQSLQSPEAAAAVGVDVGITLTGSSDQ